jgi:hypothetical protein
MASSATLIPLFEGTEFTAWSRKILTKAEFLGISQFLTDDPETTKKAITDEFGEKAGPANGFEN